ncbi:hypothetical protein PAEPH01_0251 [Pancytospora epiphaga]|nr:hypothetical protein PAEPH01_0251 [Pancytospora epiphaga]
MEQDHDIEEINRLYNRVQDLERLKEEYALEKAFIKELYGNIKGLQERKGNIDLNENIARINELEKQYLEIFRKIDFYNTNETHCNTMEQLERVFECTSDSQIHKRKCIELISSFVTSEKLEDEDSGSIKLCIKNTVEKVLGLAYNKGILTEVSKGFSDIVKAQLGDCIPGDIICYQRGQSYILVRRGNRDVSYEPGCLSKDKRMNLPELVEHTPRSGLVLLMQLRENMANLMITRSLSIEEIRKNNDLLKGSNVFIKNIPDWVVDAIVRRAVGISKGVNTDISEIDTVFVRETGVFISESYSQLRTCQRMFGEVLSVKKEKARPVLSEAILRFLKKRTTNDHREMFMAYSDVTEQQRLEYGIIKNEELVEMRESLFMEIIRYSTTLEIKMGDSSLSKKAKLKGLCSDFLESVDAFIAELARAFFIGQFFGSLYGNFLAFIMHPRKYSRDELVELADVSRYALGLSFEYRKEPMENYDKLGNMILIMEASITQLSEMYRRKQIHFDKAELRTIIRMFHDSSEEREKFLETIY